jgi:uncharacterized membrane protein
MSPFFMTKYNMDSKFRSLVKTISWRLTGTLATFIISYIILRDITVSGSIAIIQLTANSIIFYFHERLWNIISWGKNKSD